MKLLSVIVSSLFVSSVITSYFDTEEVEYSPDAIIHAFTFNTVHGVNYKLTIDQFRPDGVGLTYNQDSPPMGSDTIIDRILIKTLTTASGIIMVKNAEGQDTSFSYSDSTGFRGTTKKSTRIKVWTADMRYIKEYTISVRVHRQDLDSMNWTKVTDNFTSYDGHQKFVILGEDTLVYIVDTTAYKSSGDVVNKGRSWTQVSITGFPENIKLSPLIASGEKLHATDGEKIYVSSDGASWSPAIDLNKNGKVEILIAPFPKNEGNLPDISGIVGIINNGSRSTFAISNPKTTVWNISSEEVSSDFPLDDLSVTFYLSAIGIQTIAVMGNSRGASDTTLMAWSLQDGLLWIPLKTSSTTAYCPRPDKSSSFYYGDAFWAFGGKFETIHTSEAGPAQYKADKKIFLPTEFKDRGNNHSTVMDKDNFIWVIWSNGDANEVWRGRLNRFGFARQNKQLKKCPIKSKQI